MQAISSLQVKEILDKAYLRYNTPQFIEQDPIAIPHLFSQKQDIEIMGFFAATLAWGNRTTIIKKCKELITLFDNAPYQFILQHQESDLKALQHFKHRTFQPTDLLYFVAFLRYWYEKHTSLETAFLVPTQAQEIDVKKSLIQFHEFFFGFLSDYPKRTQKHIATPLRNSACKRLNLFLRWMVRKDSQKVDFGLWHGISTRQLICPCDVHVERVALHLGLIPKIQSNWQTAQLLTQKLRTFDAEDPVKYDFALFGLGAYENWG
ncbi:MAG: TIGR02757 family protein [Microscillaceae bacterium]|nr:TIGR02757 family protein [Microscillaceae bacterium]MDW8461956.1 TIGR02757 family protein [Cytophagales bacterium]